MRSERVRSCSENPKEAPCSVNDLSSQIGAMALLPLLRKPEHLSQMKVSYANFKPLSKRPDSQDPMQLFDDGGAEKQILMSKTFIDLVLFVKHCWT